MVKRVCFIVEGACEKQVVESAMFKRWASANDIAVCDYAVNAKGGGNLLPKNIETLIGACRAQNPDHIVVLTDLENDPDPATVRARINHQDVSFVGVAIKALEAWYLADWDAIDSWLRDKKARNPVVPTENPEGTANMPWDEIKAIAIAAYNKGPGNKLQFTKSMVERYGFDIEKSAGHVKCTSAAEFINALIAL